MKHIKLEEFHKDNWHLYEKHPDENFSPERNFQVIDQTIKEYEKMRFGVDPEVQMNAGNVADILATFAKYKLDQDGGKQIEQWLGKHWMSKIYGEKLLEKIKALESIKKLNRQKGNTKFENYYLT